MESNITDEIQQIEQQYATMPPDTGRKKINEPIYDENYIKIEDTTNNLHEKIETTVNNSYSKTKVINSDDVLYGVIKNGNSCGAYPELDVYMDCEDHNPATTSHGWTGSSYVDNAKNVMLKFCIVDASAQFHRTNVDYGVLSLGITNPFLGGTIHIKTFTNEVGDHGAGNNINSTTYKPLNGTSTDIHNLNFYSNVLYFPFSDYSHPRCFDCFGNAKNYYLTELYFFYFPKDPSYNEMEESDFPNLATLGGYNYGVFGRFGQNQGYIFTDDEDNDKNENYWKKNYNSGGISNIIENVDGVNSRIYFSKVKNCSN